MKPILNKDRFPKYLRVNIRGEQWVANKHLLKPWKAGEIVKVKPYEQQKYVKDIKTFMRFVTVIRKDENGEWNLEYTWDWYIFDLLSTNK